MARQVLIHSLLSMVSGRGLHKRSRTRKILRKGRTHPLHIWKREKRRKRRTGLASVLVSSLVGQSKRQVSLLMDLLFGYDLSWAVFKVVSVSSTSCLTSWDLWSAMQTPQKRCSMCVCLCLYFSVCVCLCVPVRVCVCGCVCEREKREREREKKDREIVEGCRGCADDCSKQASSFSMTTPMFVYVTDHATDYILQKTQATKAAVTTRTPIRKPAATAQRALASKAPATGPLHPSWQAKKRQQQVQATAMPLGSRKIFSDTDDSHAIASSVAPAKVLIVPGVGIKSMRTASVSTQHADKLHPSWVAKRAAALKQAELASSTRANKIVFDED